MSKVHVKTGDTVIVISGKDKGKQGQVLAVSPKEGKVIVEKVNMVSKHVKPRKKGEQGGIVKDERAMNATKDKWASRVASLRLKALCMHLRFRSFALVARSRQELLTRFTKTVLRAVFALNVAKHFKEDIRYGKT